MWRSPACAQLTQCLASSAVCDSWNQQHPKHDIDQVVTSTRTRILLYCYILRVASVQVPQNQVIVGGSRLARLDRLYADSEMPPKSSPAGAHHASAKAFESGYQATFVNKLNYGYNAGPSFQPYQDLAPSSSKAGGSQTITPQDIGSPDIWYCLVLYCGKQFSGSWTLAAHMAEVHRGSYEMDYTHPAFARQSKALDFWADDAISHTNYQSSRTSLGLSNEKNDPVDSSYLMSQPATEHQLMQPEVSDTSTQGSNANSLTEYLMDGSEVDGASGTAPSIMSSELDTEGSLFKRGEASKRQRSVSPQQRGFLQSKKLAVTRYNTSNSFVHSSNSISEDMASDTDPVYTGQEFDHEEVQVSQERPECSCKFSNRRHALLEHCQKIRDDPGSVQALLPEDWKWDLQYQSGLVGSGETGVWTCTPFEPEDSVSYPLTIAGAPVVIPVEHQWPPTGGVNPPPDPRPLSLVDHRTALSTDIVRDIFMTFEGCVGFYLLINGTLQLIVSEEFDTTLAASHLPHKYGGLRICYIKHNVQPTMLPANRTTLDARINSSTQRSAFSRLFRSSRPTSIVTATATALQLNDFIEARGTSAQRLKYAGRIGLRVAKDGSQFLLMSSHVITEAILSRSFLGAGRVHMERLKEDWNLYAEIWAANERVSSQANSYAHL